MPDLSPQLSPPSTSLPIKDLGLLSSDQYEELFGRLHTFRDRFLARWYFGQQLKPSKKPVTRHWFLGTWDRITSALKLCVRDTRRMIDKRTGQEATFFHDSICRLSADDLRLLCGETLYNELLADHRDTILGVAIQLIEADRKDHEDWLAQRGRQRVALPISFDTLQLES